MVTRQVRIGSLKNVHQYDDGDYSEAVDTDDQPIKIGQSTDPSHAIRDDQIPVNANIISSTNVISDHAVVRGDGGAREVQESSLTLDDSGNLSKNTDDLDLDCGANKTLRLVQEVWEDLQFSVSGAKVPAANAPTWEALTVNHKAYSFDVNDYKDQEANELPHWWKEGTDGKVHIHTTTKIANATGNDRFAKYTVYIAHMNASNVWVEASLTAELTIPNGTVAKQGFKLLMGTLTLTGLTLGTQIGCRIERITATGGTEYADNMFITQVGIHLEKDTMGSRQEVIK